MSETDVALPKGNDTPIGRERALAIARSFVLGLYPDREDRSHPRTTGEMREMLSQMLAIAEFLAGEPTGVDPDTLSKILEVVSSIDASMP